MDWSRRGDVSPVAVALEMKCVRGRSGARRSGNKRGCIVMENLWKCPRVGEKWPRRFRDGFGEAIG
jgi:hypothetical protein